MDAYCIRGGKQERKEGKERKEIRKEGRKCGREIGREGGGRNKLSYNAESGKASYRGFHLS